MTRMARAAYDAWFGSKHPAEGRECPICGARSGKPCVARVAMPGTCVSEGIVLMGMHYERLAVVEVA
jgi:hypothetical protein